MRKISTFFFSLLIFSGLLAQRTDPTRDFRKTLFWGIAFSGTSAKMKTVLHPEFYNRTDSLLAIRPMAQSGGGFGGTLAVKFGAEKRLELKTQTMLQLHQRNIQYIWKSVPTQTLKIETISFDIPLDLKYYSVMPRNTRFYVLAGLRWSHDFQSNEGVPIGASKPLVAIKDDTYYYEFGAGWEFRLQYVDLSLELRMSNGINNALVRIPDSYYSGSLKAIYPRLFSLTLMAQN
jgi:Outer membrane protein beta-barrel domain